MTNASFAIIIPARFASTRYPGKPLVELKGASGERKSLIRRSWECASKVQGCVGVWVATDDERIAAEVRGFGGQVVMTAESCTNGTERCADAMARLGSVADIIINFQGDAPLSPPEIVRYLVNKLETDREAVMATPVVQCSQTIYDHLERDAEHGRVGGTTAVFDQNHRAMYFSKRMIPYFAQSVQAGDPVPIYLHLGMYAYRPESLRAYAAAAPSALEQLEGLEQLRFLELGLAVSVVPVPPLEWDAVELNNPSDVPAIELILAERGIH